LPKRLRPRKQGEGARQSNFLWTGTVEPGVRENSRFTLQADFNQLTQIAARKSCRFSNRSLAYDGTNNAVASIAILKNTLNHGSSFHLKLREPDANGYFLWHN
jgi:hypothetical protein